MDSSSCSNSSIRSFSAAACRSWAGVNCNRSIAAQLRKPYGIAIPYFATEPLVGDGAGATEAWLEDGAGARLRHGHEVSMSKWLDRKDRLWHTCHALRLSSLQQGSPPPPPLTDPAGCFLFS